MAAIESKAGSAASSHVKAMKFCKKSGPCAPSSKATSDVSKSRGLISLPDGIPCIHCDKVLKNKNGLSRHMRKVHPKEEEESSSEEECESMEVDETLIVDTPGKGDKKPAAARNGLTVNEHFEETQKLMNSLTTGTEIIGKVEDGVACGVCLLKVERSTYGEHLGAHVEAAKLQFAYLGEVLERTAESVRSLEAGSVLWCSKSHCQSRHRLLPILPNPRPEYNISVISALFSFIFPRARLIPVLSFTHSLG